MEVLCQESFDTRRLPVHTRLMAAPFIGMQDLFAGQCVVYRESGLGWAYVIAQTEVNEQ